MFASAPDGPTTRKPDGDGELHHLALGTPPPNRDATRAQEYLGLRYKIPWSVWGGEWANSTRHITGMVVAYTPSKCRDRSTFTLKFPPISDMNLKTDVVYLNWSHVLGETLWCGVELRPLHAVQVGVLMDPPPRSRKVAAADCWDMRRGEWVWCDGRAVTAMTRVEINAERTTRRHNDPVSRARNKDAAKQHRHHGIPK